jgi:hypothetical protein
MTVTVYNNGTPSIIKGMRLVAKLEDGTAVEGERMLPSQKELIFKDLNLKFYRDQALALKGTANPIATGGQCDGFVAFVLPANLRKQLQKATYELIIYDVQNNPYSTTLLMGDRKGNPFMISPPDMVQKDH